MKKLIQFCLVLVALLATIGARAQVMNFNTEPRNICFKDFTSTTVQLNNLPVGVNVDTVYLDYTNDGIPEATLLGPSTYYSYQYVYQAPGPYTITATVKYTNGQQTVGSISGIVYRLPIPDFGFANSRIQCFRDNRIDFIDKSIKTDNKIVKATWIFGDGNNRDVKDPFFGQIVSHSYNFSNTFLITLRVIDSVGCTVDTVSGPDNSVIIKDNIAPDFVVSGARGCFKSEWMLQNLTTAIPFAALNRYKWDFGDGSSTERTKPFNLPTDELNFDTISHVYTKSGSFYPTLVIEDSTGCIDSLKLGSDGRQVPENINFVFDIRPQLNTTDTTRRDSVCFGDVGGSTLVFYHKPIDFALGGTGDFLWNFGDPPTQQLNFNNQSWQPSHAFSSPKQFIVTLTIKVDPCDTAMTDTIDVLGPRARIENPQAPITIDPGQKSQCIIDKVIEFPNTSMYYKSEHVWRIWDFADDVAPKCTSYLVPNAGWPFPGGWEYQATPPLQQYTNSTGYWMMNGIHYPGKRIDCNYSLDTLPVHKYTDWDMVYQYYRYGHDFMPWDTTRYTRNPADTLPTANPRKFWVMPYDSLLWGKPVYLDPQTGQPTPVQGTWTDPFTGQSIPFPRIDTIDSKNTPQDLQPYHRFNINKGTPDPFELEKGNYLIFPPGKVVDPKVVPMFTHKDPTSGKLLSYSYEKKLTGQDANKTFYRYLFDREVQKCITVRLFLKDSQNHIGNSFPIQNDYLVLDSLDCNHEASVQLSLVRPDARGLGIFHPAGKMCPGKWSQGENGIRFHLDATQSGLGNYPGINPDCGQTLIYMNHDSLADRLDNTPCVLDGFIDWQGGQTPGGILRPPYTNIQDWSNPLQFWQSPTGTSTWYHYGPNTVFGGNVLAPTDPTGNVTVGLIVGAGAAPNICVSDTVWYHKFLWFKELNAKFFVDPVTNPTTGVVTNGECKLYCRDWVKFVYQDSSQDSVAFSHIEWGDNWVTVDSFDFEPAIDNGYYRKGFRRVRYDYYFGPCGGNVPVLTLSTPFPHGDPGIRVDTLYWDNYTYRLYDPLTNPNGSLVIDGFNTAGDSIQVTECSKQYWIATKDTLKYWYRMELRDSAMMLWPVYHKYNSTSWEDGCKTSTTTPRAVFHYLESVKKCRQFEVDDKLLVRGVIDTVSTWSYDSVSKTYTKPDTIFCINEPVYFMDSVRYWRPDCSLTDPIFNPNLNWLTGDPLGDPYVAMNIDTIDYWRLYSDNPDKQWPDGTYIEKLKWFFGDGDSAVGPRPVHTYKQSGRYTVTMVSTDKNFCHDTTYAYINVSIPVSKPITKPGLYNCGDIVTFFDTSSMFYGNNFTTPDSVRPVYWFESSSGLVDSIQHNYWFFGERTTDTLQFDGKDLDTAKWNYRRNGYFRIKLVSETYQGCTDTGWTDVYINGPQPFFKIIGDTIGCAPFKVKIVNLADINIPDPDNAPTKVTIINWGDKNNSQMPSIKTYDTLEFTYTDTGTFYIFGAGDDQNPPSNNVGCGITFYPDTVNGNQAPIRITVKTSYPANIAVSQPKVCVDQPFNIINTSDSSSYLQYQYLLYSADTLTELASSFGGNNQLVFPYAIDSPGTYLVIVNPTQYKPGLPACKLTDTTSIEVVEPTALFTPNDTSGKASQINFTNLSLGAALYDWEARDLKDTSIIKAFAYDKVEADKDWAYSFGTDTGDVLVCLKAYTADPAKPICYDLYCDTISYKYVVKFKIYNVFTPTSDGKNDVFDIEIEGGTMYDLHIYNRWGVKVFESKDPNVDWNGKNKNDGSDCPEGTYFYVFKYELLNGEKDELHGTITLLRK